jgi:hypothetical protein
MNQAEKKRADSFKYIYDTMNLFVEVSEEVYLPEDTKEWVNSYIASIQESKNLSKEDRIYLRLVKKLERKTGKIKIDITKINPTYEYEIIRPFKYSVFEYLYQDAGFIGFSQIIFNISGNKACVYTCHIVSLTAGNGYIIYLKKIYGKWIIRGIRDIWIS